MGFRGSSGGSDDERELAGLEQPDEHVLGATLSDRKRFGPFLDGSECALGDVVADAPLEVGLFHGLFRVEDEPLTAGEEQRPRVADRQVAVAVLEEPEPRVAV